MSPFSPPRVLVLLPPDARLLFATRILRLFAYGLLSVVLMLYLVRVGLGVAQVGVLLTLTLVGDTAVSLLLTTEADRLGRRRMLLVGSGLVFMASALFAWSHSFLLLTVAATLGVISPSGNEVGPFLAIELAALSQTVPVKERALVLAWYNLVGSFATALGTLAGGALTLVLQSAGWPDLESCRAVVVAYGLRGLLLAALFARLSPGAEAAMGTPARPGGDAAPARPLLGLRRSRGVVMRLSALFALDAFGGGFVVQSIVAYWFHVRFGVAAGALGGIFFGANLLAGISALSAARLAARISLINTMVFTHIPSNVLLMLVPLMPNVGLATTVLLLRFSISHWMSRHASPTRCRWWNPRSAPLRQG
ncbi:MAG TPA: MFS transporter [Armatimonadota bacterium]